MRLGIIGGGFGLYGYAPVVAQIADLQPVLVEAYRPKLRSRSDLAYLEEQVAWVANTDALIGSCDGLLIATNPAQQPDYVARAVKAGRVRRILLEKPLAITPASAIALLDAIEVAGLSVGLGYNFHHLAWAGALEEEARQGDVAVQWTFNAHHFKHDVDTWKKRPDQGGGALRFYGIHLVALMARLGFDRVIDSRTMGSDRDLATTWQATFADPNGRRTTIYVDSKSPQTQFRVIGPDGEVSVDQADPYTENDRLGQADRRHATLSHVLADAFCGPPHPISAPDRAAIALWDALEQADANLDNEKHL